MALCQFDEPEPCDGLGASSVVPEPLGTASVSTAGADEGGGTSDEHPAIGNQQNVTTSAFANLDFMSISTKY
ncbi:hypothetical protein Pla52o_22470 [Novipirellula galeiformis]|uniref:Uncharacterized protein n=1 Tax=Novipirellula galeiformis TaxID=2528004 RepID=A0A5C6CI86_9BACT|nr:hypothetical protein Pla52o_22470 [Novipirellula galeiformis]